MSQPEGNLFKDRYLALQKKALIEPRVKQMYVHLPAYLRASLTYLQAQASGGQDQGVREARLEAVRMSLTACTVCLFIAVCIVYFYSL